MEKFTPNFTKGCPFCNAGEKEVDYKDIRTLKRFIAENGKIVPGRMSMLCRYHQKAVSTAIKRARIVALLPFTDND